MSSIPNSAMPHAGPQPSETDDTDGQGRLGQLGSGIADMVREHPKTAAVAGAAVVGLAAAAAYPAFRGRTETKGGSKKKSG